MKKIWVAIPAYTGEICVQNAHSVNVEIYDALNKKIPLLVTYHIGDSMISRCRNLMVMKFLASDFTDMIFLDADVAFEPGTLCKLANYSEDIVGAAYPFKTDETGFPVRWLNQEFLYGNENGLLEVYAMPAGCLKISRKAIEAMIAKFPELEYAEGKASQGKAYALFDFIRKDGIFYGEDYVFCALAREAGFGIYCDPNVNMEHIGPKRHQGHLGNWLMNRNDPFRIINEFNAKNAK